MKFVYRAIDQGGRTARGSVDASNEVDLELRLKKIGLDLITFRVRRTDSLFARGNRVSREELITFFFQLEQMTRAGIPLFDGLTDLRDSTDHLRLKEVTAALREDLEGGKLLSQALGAHPTVFNPVMINLVKAGEQTGRLPEVFEKLVATLKWQNEIARKTTRLLIYPVVVLVVIVAVIVFLMLYLVPQLSSFLKSLGQELPLQTKILIYVSEVFVSYWYVIFTLPIVIAFAIIITLRRSSRLRYAYDYGLLRLPVVGHVIEKVVLARFAHFFALMYQSGIAILDALKISDQLVSNRAVSEALQRAAQQINAGESLAESFRNVGLFPPLIIRMLRIGETTGALDTALYNVSYFYTQEVEDLTERALKLLEPALTLVLGIVLALVVFAVLSPIYDLLTQLPM